MENIHGKYKNGAINNDLAPFFSFNIFKSKGCAAFAIVVFIIKIIVTKFIDKENNPTSCRE